VPCTHAIGQGDKVSGICQMRLFSMLDKASCNHQLRAQMHQLQGQFVIEESQRRESLWRPFVAEPRAAWGIMLL
jgi:hypothetical protein